MAHQLTDSKSRRFLLPGLAALLAAGKLPEDFRVVGAGRQDLDDLEVRSSAAERLEEHGRDLPAAAKEALLRSLSYRQVDFDNPDSVARAIADRTAPAAAYLALPPGMFASAIIALGAVGLSRRELHRRREALR